MDPAAFMPAVPTDAQPPAESSAALPRTPPALGRIQLGGPQSLLCPFEATCRFTHQQPKQVAHHVEIVHLRAQQVHPASWLVAADCWACAKCWRLVQRGQHCHNSSCEAAPELPCAYQWSFQHLAHTQQSAATNHQAGGTCWALRWTISTGCATCLGS